MEDLRLKPVNKLCAINHKEKKKKKTKTAISTINSYFFFTIRKIYYG